MSIKAIVRTTLIVVVPLAVSTCSPADQRLTFETSEKVCQLTGDKDWVTGKPMRKFPSTFFGLGGTDLGYPVEHNGRLALLFGDTRTVPPLPPHQEFGPPDDAIAWVTSRKAPTEEECTDLLPNHDVKSVQLPLLPRQEIRVLKSPAVVSTAMPQGLFNVPSGGVSHENWLYVFFWTDHCTDRTRSNPCPETKFLNSHGRGVLARSNDDGRNFVDAVPMPLGFVYSTAVDAVATEGVPEEQKLGTYIFGVPKYRASVPYLAYAPPGALKDPTAWQFFIGIQPDGEPGWASSQIWSSRTVDVRGRGKPWTPPGQPDLFRTSADGKCIGEFSMTWNRVLGVWLLLYNCDRGGGNAIEARVADAPWGPWSAPTIILDADRDDSWCRFLMKQNDPRCAGRVDDWRGPELQRGDLYAPFVMERYTVRQKSNDFLKRKATIYWLLSTWNPYQVIVMRTSLTVDKPLLSIKAKSRPK